MQQVRQHVQLDTAMCSFGESASPMAFSEMARRKDNLQSLAFVGFPFLKKTSLQDLFCQIPFVTVILYRDVRKRQPFLFSLFQQISFPGQKNNTNFYKTRVKYDNCHIFERRAAEAPEAPAWFQHMRNSLSFC